MLGREVRSSADENMGRIVDVIVDRTGHVRAAIIDFGGFLGVGSRKIAVDWNALRFHPDSAKRDVITLELTRDQVKEAPEYKDKQPVVVLGASGGLQSLPAVVVAPEEVVCLENRRHDRSTGRYAATAIVGRRINARSSIVPRPAE